MTSTQEKRGGAPVGFVADLDRIGAASVIYLRMWHDGPDGQEEVWGDLSYGLGAENGRKALKAFEKLCSLCSQYGRRPLFRHAVSCKCIGSDESCFANFIETATSGDRVDAILIATLLVRADIASLITTLAIDFGLAIKGMNPRSPTELDGGTSRTQSGRTTLH